MSTSYAWLFLAATAGECEAAQVLIEGRFAALPELDKKVKAALAKSHDDLPDDPEQREALVTAFSSLSSGDEDVNELVGVGEAVINGVTLERLPPALVLSIALGAEAANLPGKFGDIVLRAKEVAEAESVVRSVLEKADRTHFVEVASGLVSALTADPVAFAENLLRELPEAMREAKRRRRGFVAIGTELV